MGETMRFRVDRNWPWIKIGLPVVLALFAYVMTTGVLRRTIWEGELVVPNAPMAIQAEVPNMVYRRTTEGKKLLALTFDDGPRAETTPKLLDILMENDAVATFFQLGFKVRNEPEITRRAKREGHEVASHTMWHQNLIRVPRTAAEEDIAEAKKVFVDVIGEAPSLTRMPYGNSDSFTAKVTGTPLIYWSVDTRDWESLDRDAVVEQTLDAVYDGAIVLMHDIHPSTIEAVPIVIEKLREDGYEFVTVSELARMRGVELKAGETYYGFRP